MFGAMDEVALFRHTAPLLQAETSSWDVGVTVAKKGGCVPTC